jgi:hypothetical protein
MGRTASTSGYAGSEHRGKNKKKNTMAINGMVNLREMPAAACIATMKLLHVARA